MPGALTATLDHIPSHEAPALLAQAAVLARPATIERRMADAIRALVPGGIYKPHPGTRPAWTA